MRITTNIFGELGRALGLAQPDPDMSSMEVPTALLKVNDFPAPIDAGGGTTADIAVRRTSFSALKTRILTGGGASFSEDFATFGRGVWRINAYGVMTSDFLDAVVARFIAEVRLVHHPSVTSTTILGFSAGSGLNAYSGRNEFTVMLPSDTTVLTFDFQADAVVGNDYKVAMTLMCSKML